MTEQEHTLPRVMIAAPHGRSGKTVLVLGILRALKRHGVDVQPFKKGPDYIDPGWHSVAAGRESRNLDSFFMDGPMIRAVLHEASNEAQLALIEGAMGFYDGSDVEGSSSSAEVAKQTSTPVILVIDTTRMTRTVAAIVLGCQELDHDVNIAGVILNRVRGARHEGQMREAIERYCGIPVIGAIPENEQMGIPDRHLGLVTSAESDSSSVFADGVAAIIEEHVDLDLLMKIARSAPPLRCDDTLALPAVRAVDDAERVKIAVVRDRVFNFYYPENLQALEAAGAELVFVDSLSDGRLPDDACGLYIGGGFPEVFAEELQANEPFRQSVKAAIDEGIACCAECGGLMYLAHSLQTDGSTFQMAGAFSVDIAMEAKRQGHGYSLVVARENHPWLASGTMLKGHEHHHSHVVGAEGDEVFAYENKRGRGIRDHFDGLCRNRTVASYTHVNALASPQWAMGLVDAARAFQSEKTAGSCST